MTRAEQLVFCERCLNRKMDIGQGLICNLTGAKASFENECIDFKRDEAVKDAPPREPVNLQASEITMRLSPEMVERLRMEQRPIPGFVAGLAAGIIGAVLWGVITVVTGYQIGYMALAIGAVVGLAIRKFGNGIDAAFGVMGGAIALFSVLLGNFLSIIGFIANAEGLGYIETLLLFNYSYLPDIMMETFSVIDLLFYGIAIYEGYKFSFRVISEKKILELSQERV